MVHYNFFGPVDDKASASFINFLLKCYADKEEAVVFLNSGGGTEYAMHAIYQVVKETKVPLTIIGMGRVASAASAIFALGDRRIITEGTVYMVHRGSTYYKEDKFQVRDLKKETERLERGDQKYAQLFFKTGINMDVIKEHCDNGDDWCLTPEELKKYNVVTEDSEGWIKYMK